jgi:hypothetical protein
VKAVNDSTRLLTGYMEMVGKRLFTRLDFLTSLGMKLTNSTAQIISMMFTVSADISVIRAFVVRLERPLVDEYFILEDATGRCCPIHLRTIVSWESFDFVIYARFKGKKGGRRVRRKQYSLYTRNTGLEVDRTQDWDVAFLPYETVDMSLLCREVQRDEDSMSLVSCPRCHAILPGETGTQVEW